MSTITRQAQPYAKLAALGRTRSTAIPVRQALPYHIIRNSRGSLPVYSDIKNNGTKYLVHVRNIQGDANALLQDLRASLVPSREETVLRGQVVRSKHLVLQGHCKAHVMDWLKMSGF